MKKMTAPLLFKRKLWEGGGGDWDISCLYLHKSRARAAPNYVCNKGWRQLARGRQHISAQVLTKYVLTTIVYTTN